MLNIDLTRTPHSRFGSYVALAILTDRKEWSAGAPGELWWRHVHGDARPEIWHLEAICDGHPVPAEITSDGAELRLSSGDLSLSICLLSDDGALVSGRGLGLRLTATDKGNTTGMMLPGGDAFANIHSAFRCYRFHPRRGTARIDAPWHGHAATHVVADLLPDAAGCLDAAIAQTRGMPGALPDDRDPATEVARCREELSAFTAPYLAGATDPGTTALAAYTNWSAVVRPDGHFGRPAMLMSKWWMHNVWSWDHAFNAMALAAVHPDLAWDQWLLMFDHQLPNGQLPDMINSTVRLYNYTKPPVHGWALRRLLSDAPRAATRERLVEAYERLTAWTRFWSRQRTGPDGLPFYAHGFDCGWDNATIFAALGYPAATPELAAFLADQMQTCADLARRLDREAEATEWDAAATALQQRLLDSLWQGDRFAARNVVDGRLVTAPNCLVTNMPILLGERLPPPVATALAANIRRHLTDWGLATEHPDSPAYEVDGYWRGPIWAPPTMIAADGLRRAGHPELASTIAERYARLCAVSGFAENFDTLTGASLRDPAYTWTSSTFLMLQP